MKAKYIISGLVLLSGIATIKAQTNTYSGYFLDNFLYRHQMNPAFGNDYNFVGMPGAGNLSIGTEGTVHLSHILYNYDGKTVLFTNPDLPDNEVKHFGNSNKLGVNLRENILNGGFKAWGGYNTVSISAVANSRISAPGSLMNMLREGISN